MFKNANTKIVSVYPVPLKCCVKSLKTRNSHTLLMESVKVVVIIDIGLKFYTVPLLALLIVQRSRPWTKNLHVKILHFFFFLRTLIM